MNTFFQVTMKDFRESIRARWFLMYCLIFGGAIVLLFVLGITESSVLGFTGLSRVLITYIQLCVANTANTHFGFNCTQRCGRPGIKHS